MRSRFHCPDSSMIPVSEVPTEIVKDEPPEWSAIRNGVRLNLAPPILTIIEDRDKGKAERGWRVVAYVWFGPLSENDRVMRLESRTWFEERDCHKSVAAEFGEDIIDSLVRFIEDHQ